jgi:hypothetical protein
MSSLAGGSSSVRCAGRYCPQSSPTLAGTSSLPLAVLPAPSRFRCTLQRSRNTSNCAWHSRSSPMPAAFATRSGARLRQANRLFALGGVLTPDELMIIAADDIRKSRVFTERKSGLPAEPRADDRAQSGKAAVFPPCARSGAIRLADLRFAQSVAFGLRPSRPSSFVGQRPTNA